MKRAEVAKLARELLNQHGFGHVPFEFDRGTKRIGACHFKRDSECKRYVSSISFSHHWAGLLDEKDIRDTILHELAHAIAGFEAGHGPRWKAAARRIGANPTRTHDGIPNHLQAKVHNYVAICENNSEHKVYFDKMGKNWRLGRYRCGKCKGQLHVHALR